MTATEAILAFALGLMAIITIIAILAKR